MRVVYFFGLLVAMFFFVAVIVFGWQPPAKDVALAAYLALALACGARYFQS